MEHGKSTKPPIHQPFLTQSIGDGFCVHLNSYLNVGGDYVEVENLAPSTTYNIQCKATSKANEASVLSSVQMIITKPAIFEITYAEQHGDYVFVRLNSNMDNTVSCKLLGGSTEGDANEVMITDTMVSFRVDKSHEEYKVGCSAYNQNYSGIFYCKIPY